MVVSFNCFIGKQICNYLTAAGHRVVANGPFETGCYDRIYYVPSPAKPFLTQQKSMTHLLDQWQRLQPQALLVAVGSSESYGLRESREEGAFFKGVVGADQMLLSGLQSLHAQRGLSYLFVIAPRLFGREGFTGGNIWIYALIRSVLRAKIYGERASLLLSHSEVLPMGDFLPALEKVIAGGKNGWVNIGAGETAPMGRWVESVCRRVGFPAAEVEFVETEVPALCIERARRWISYAPRPTLETACDLIDWVAAHPELI